MSKSRPKPQKRKARPKLAEALLEAGFNRHPDDFKVIVLEVFHGNYSDWTDEDLLFDPTEALKFCRRVNDEAGTNLRTDVILACLINCRKAGFGIDHAT